MHISDSTPHILLIGAGAMAQAIAWEITRRLPARRMIVIDRNNEALDRFARKIDSPAIRIVSGDAGDMKLLSGLFENASVGIGAATYVFNETHSRLAIESGSSWIDLGGNNDVVDAQFAMDESAKKAKVAVIPDCGLAPGMVNVIGAYMISKLDSIEEMHFRVGGLPRDPKPPLFYGLCFSPEGLINEYVEPARFIADGSIAEAPSLTGWERVHFGAPFGMLEAFHTSGGASTMIKTMLGKVSELDYKTLRYAGHLRRMKLLADIGMFESEKLVLADGTEVSPRSVTGGLLQRLGWVEEDVVLVKAWAIGTRNGKRWRIDYRIIDYYDRETGFTAMARTTGFSAAIIARMILDGRITGKGVLRQELSVPAAEFFNECRQWGINIETSDHAV